MKLQVSVAAADSSTIVEDTISGENQRQMIKNNLNQSGGIKRSRPSRVRLMAISASAFAILASGITSAGASQQSRAISHAKALTKVTLTLALDPPKMIFMGFWVAQQEGFFARNGLDVTLMPEQGGVQATRAVAAGLAYFEAGGTDAIAAAYAQAGNLEAIWSYGADDLSMIADKSILSVAGLKGKTIGAGDATGPAFELSEIALRNAGVNPSDVKVAVLNGRPALVGAMAAGAIQASVFHVDDGYTLLSKDPNVHVIATMAKVAPQFWYGAVGIPIAYGQKHRTTVIAFLESMIEAQRWMYTHSAGTIALSVKYTGETLAVVTKSYDFMKLNKLWSTGIGMTNAQVSYTLAQFKANGIIPTVPKATAIFNQTFIRSALTKVAALSKVSG